jgi:signal transduction histidine kinase
MIPSLKRIFDLRCAASIACATTVALGYLPTLWQGEIDFTHPRGIWCVILGVIYALGGMIDFAYFRRQARERWRVLYLCGQAGLLLGILWNSRLTGEMSLCVYPLVAATVTLVSPTTATFGVGFIYAMTLAVEARFHGFEAFIRWSMSLLPGFGFVVIFTRLAVNEKVARIRAESLSTEIEKLAVIQERNRLAREIHDSLGHFLTTIHVQLEAARTIHPSDPDGALKAVAKAQGLARDALVEVRRSVGSLQADRVPVPLAARLRELASVTDGWGAAVSLEVLGTDRPLAPEIEHAFFRTAQEGLTNVRKHAQARSALVLLDYRDARRVCVRVTDDGLGMATASHGHGLAGLHERIAALGGHVVAANSPDGGFRLHVEIPA